MGRVGVHFVKTFSSATTDARLVNAPLLEYILETLRFTADVTSLTRCIAVGRNFPLGTPPNVELKAWSMFGFLSLCVTNVGTRMY